MNAALRTPHLEPARTTIRPIRAARLVAATDVAALLLPLLVLLARHHAGTWPATPRELLAMQITIQDLGLLAIFSGLTLLAYHALSLYDAARVRRPMEELGRTGAAASMVVVAAIVVANSGHPSMLDRPALLVLAVATLTAAITTRAVRAGVSRPARCCRTVIVGSGPQALRVCRELSRDPIRAYRVLGFVDTNDTTVNRFVARRTLGTLDELEALLAREHVDEVHIGLPIRSQYPKIQETIRVCESLGVKVVYPADLFDTELAWPHVDLMQGVDSPRVELHLVADGVPVFVKRMVDMVGAIVALILLSPVMIAAALAIKLTSPGPVIFAQERYGLNRSRFRMLKFRTMVVDAERLQGALEAKNEAGGPVFKIARDPRITPIGRWLRRTSIDELPQLFNVLKGDMSLVGPRPLPVRDVLRFTRRSDLRRFSVRPGLTGLWQVSGRSSVTDFERWVALDLHYIDRWSLALDAAILARTIPAVIRGTGAV